MIPRHLADLDELILSCRDEKARALIQEAHACYRAGAYRSAVIATWVAIIYDLIEKVRELALDGDVEAKSEIDALDKALTDNNVEFLKRFEPNFFAFCDTKLGFFQAIERKDLDRIFADRNLAAHPSHIRPGDAYEVSAELARLHMRSAIEIVLSQPATTGKAAKAALDQLAASPSLPETREKIRGVLATGPLAKPKPSLFRDFIQQLVKQTVEPGLSKSDRRKRIELMGAAFDLHPMMGLELAKNSLRRMLSKALENELVWVVAIVANIAPIAEEIEEGLKLRLETFIENGDENEVADIAVDALSIHRFADKMRKRISNMDVFDLSTVVRSGLHSLDSSVLDRGIDLLKDAAQKRPSWLYASQVISSILQRGVKEFTFPQLERLFQIVDERASKITPASGFNDLIEALRENPALAKGVFEQELQKRDWGRAILGIEPTSE